MVCLEHPRLASPCGNPGEGERGRRGGDVVEAMDRGTGATARGGHGEFFSRKRCWDLHDVWLCDRVDTGNSFFIGLLLVFCIFFFFFSWIIDATLWKEAGNLGQACFAS